LSSLPEAERGATGGLAAGWKVPLEQVYTRCQVAASVCGKCINTETRQRYLLSDFKGTGPFAQALLQQANIQPVIIKCMVFISPLEASR
jgi:hypothetical protein